MKHDQNALDYLKINSLPKYNYTFLTQSNKLKTNLNVLPYTLIIVYELKIATVVEIILFPPTG